MKHVAAYLLLVAGGNENPSAEDIKSLLGTVGVEADTDRLDKLISELSGKTLSEVIAEGTSKLASVPSGGAVAASGAGGAAAAATGGAAAEEKKEEKKEEEKEESDDDMGFGLFD